MPATRPAAPTSRCLTSGSACRASPAPTPAPTTDRRSASSDPRGRDHHGRAGRGTPGHRPHGSSRRIHRPSSAAPRSSACPAVGDCDSVSIAAATTAPATPSATPPNDNSNSGGYGGDNLPRTGQNVLAPAGSVRGAGRRRCRDDGSRPAHSRAARPAALSDTGATWLPPGRPREDGPVAYDAFLLLSFGGPEHPDDVMPFLRNVTRGPRDPDERLAWRWPSTTTTSAACRRSTSSAATCWPRSTRTLRPTVCGCPRTGGTGTGADAGRHRGADARRRDRVRARLRHQRVRRLLVVQAVLGGHRRGPGARRAERAADRQAAAVPRPPGFRRRRTRTPCAPRWRRWTRPAAPPPGWSSPPTRSRSRWPTPPARTAAGTPPSCRRPPRLVHAGRRARPALGPGLAEPLRPAAGAVAGAGRQRPPGRAGREGRHRRGGEPDRVRLRPPRGDLGPGQRGVGDRPVAGHRDTPARVRPAPIRGSSP